MSIVNDMSFPEGEDDGDEPLFAIEPRLEDAIRGEGDTFRTQNDSIDDWERHKVIERTQGNIHTRVDLMDVLHGKYDGDGGEATLLVFRFRFDPQKNSRRVIRGRVNIEFFASSNNGSAPVVEAIAPEERWTVVPTTDQESTTWGGQLNLGASGVPFLETGGTASLEKTVSRDVSDATTVTGSINLGTGKNSGEPTAAAWNLLENRHREPFNAKVTLEADVDFASGLERKLTKVPLDDPVLLNPTMTGRKPKRGRSYGVQDLSSVDLYSLCEIRMAIEASFTPGEKK